MSFLGVLQSTSKSIFFVFLGVWQSHLLYSLLRKGSLLTRAKKNKKTSEAGHSAGQRAWQ